YNLKDPRLDQANELVEADKKVYAQVDIIGEADLAYADSILALAERKADLILNDLEFVETRLARDPQEAERKALEKLKALLESEQFVGSGGLTGEELQALSAHNL